LHAIHAIGRRLVAGPATRFAGLAAGGALLALLAAGCTLKSVPGPKKLMVPGFKTYAIEHPVPLGEHVVRSGTTELRIDRASTEELRTAIETKSWQIVVHGLIVNRGAAPLFVRDLADQIELHGRSGAVRTGYVYPAAGSENGWASSKGSSYIPAGGAGRVRICTPGPEPTRDDPAALTFRGTRIEFGR
jgi:hypothetical protein